MRQTYVMRDGKLVPKELAGPHPLEAKPSWQVMRGLEAFKSPVDGRIINSRQELNNHNREHGVIDVGNDRSVLEPRKKTPLPSPAEEIKRAMGRF